jgi:hypothetical protein
VVVGVDDRVGQVGLGLSDEAGDEVDPGCGVVGRQATERAEQVELFVDDAAGVIVG